MKSYAQAGQDIFARALHPSPGVFLDIGAAGLSISNTLALEEEGWTGWLVDNSEEALKSSAKRKSPFLLTDATLAKYSFLPMLVDYLSVDVDQYSLDALLRVFEASMTTFGVITCEHDAYERGEALRTPMLELLTLNGYDILCSDVCHEGKPFEIWAVHPTLVDMTVANRLRRSQPTEWREILGL